jgi:hypothetical protein
MNEGCLGCLPERTDKPGTALDRQVGGSHYKNLVFQPGEFVTKNRLTYFPSSVIKRMCRYDKPTGKGLQDLQKAKHEIDLIIELEEWVEE